MQYQDKTFSLYMNVLKHGYSAVKYEPYWDVIFCRQMASKFLNDAGYCINAKKDAKKVNKATNKRINEIEEKQRIDNEILLCQKRWRRNKRLFALHKKKYNQ